MTAARRAVLAGVVGTTASVLPAFMTGAVAVQVSADLGMDDQQLGLVIGAYFTSAALGSALLGRAAQRMGPTRAMRAGLGLTALTGLALSLVPSALLLGAVLLVSGVSNALTQPAANLLLADRVSARRLGLAMALKQAGMPFASLLGGLAVPALALTLGWRATYVAAAVLAVAATGVVPRTRAARDRAPARAASGAAGATSSGTDLPLAVLLVYAAVGALGAAAAGAIVTFLVSAAEDAGLSPAAAGLLLTGGSVVGIASRLGHGRWADLPGRRPIRRVALLLGTGGLAVGAFAVHAPGAYLLGVAPAFALGWAWPGLFNLSVVRNNPTTAAAATGITQTGVYIGAGSGPVLGGLVAQQAGYPALWAAAAATLVAAGALSAWLSRALRHRATTVAPVVPGQDRANWVR